MFNRHITCRALFLLFFLLNNQHASCMTGATQNSSDSTFSILNLTHDEKKEARSYYTVLKHQLESALLKPKEPLPAPESELQALLGDFKEKNPYFCDPQRLTIKAIIEKNNIWLTWVSTHPNLAQQLLNMYTREHIWQCSFDTTSMYSEKKNDRFGKATLTPIQAIATDQEYIFFSNGSLIECVPPLNSEETPVIYRNIVANRQLQHQEPVENIIITPQKKLIGITARSFYIWDITKDNYSQTVKKVPRLTNTYAIVEEDIYCVNTQLCSVAMNHAHVIATNKKGPLYLLKPEHKTLTEINEIDSLLPKQAKTAICLGNTYCAYAYENGIIIIVNIVKPKEYTLNASLKRQNTYCTKLLFTDDEKYFFALDANQILHVFNREDFCTEITGYADCATCCIDNKNKKNNCTTRKWRNCHLGKCYS